MEGLGRFCPAFVIELLPAADWRAKFENKMGLWISNGAQLAWLIDPYRKEVVVYEPGAESYLTAGPLIEGIGPVAGFTLDLGAEYNQFCHSVQRYAATKYSFMLPPGTQEFCHGQSERMSSIIYAGGAR
jgi:hypothetical protein